MYVRVDGTVSLTIPELGTRLAEASDEVSILEILNINSFDLVERFQDRIEKHYDKLLSELEIEDED